MIGEPPVDTPLFHFSPITEAEVVEGSNAKPTGGLGKSKILAPLPIVDAADSPYEFVAEILAITLSPYLKLNG